jgi:hypothetical protein
VRWPKMSCSSRPTMADGLLLLEFPAVISASLRPPAARS